MEQVFNPAPVRKLHVPNRPDRLDTRLTAPGRSRTGGTVPTMQPLRQRLDQPGALPSTALPMAPPPPSAFRTLGLYSLAVYLFSASANDLLHFFGGKAYLSWGAGVLMVVAFFVCGTTFRGLKANVGKAWLGFTVCLLLATPFSIWQGESADLLSVYLPRILFVFFYATAFAVKLRDCRILIMTYIICANATLLACILFGRGDETGRFSIPGSLFYGGPNELALALVCALAFALYLLLQKSTFAQIFGAGQFLITLYYLLKTGSRGCFIALVGFLVIWFVFSSSRLKLAALCIPAIALLFALSGSIMERLIDIAIPGDISASSAANEAQESQVERTMLLRKSIAFALAHPVFGTGPGTFRDALWADDVLESTHTHSLGTHNSYTQVASECGFPALFCYLGVIVCSIAANVRIMKRTRGIPGSRGVHSMALTLFSSLIAFAIATFFDHQAYTPTLPILSGMTVILALASRWGDPQWIESEAAVGNA